MKQTTIKLCPDTLPSNSNYKNTFFTIFLNLSLAPCYLIGGVKRDKQSSSEAICLIFNFKVILQMKGKFSEK